MFSWVEKRACFRYSQDLTCRSEELTQHSEDSANPYLEAQHLLQFPNSDSSITSYCGHEMPEKSDKPLLVFFGHCHELASQVDLKTEVSSCVTRQFPFSIIELNAELLRLPFRYQKLECIFLHSVGYKPDIIQVVIHQGSCFIRKQPGMMMQQSFYESLHEVFLKKFTRIL